LSIGRTIGSNRETVLKDDDAALDAYLRMITAAGASNGSAEYFYCIQGAARVLTRQREFEEAIKHLDSVDAKRLAGSWRASMQLARGEVFVAAGRHQPALQAFQAVIDDQAAAKAQRERAQFLKNELAK
jgi:tetratricopeptide (TPR) repeat protein